MHEIFAAIAAWIAHTVQTGGYIGIGGLTLLENIFPPIPSELILPVAGFLVGSGQLSFGWVVVASTIGSLVGALMLYWLGAALGEQRLRTLVQRHGKWFAMDEDDLDQAKNWFDRHGGMAVFFGRLVPSLRSLISIPAGVARMSLLPFIIYTTIGSAFWNALLVGSGWALGGQWDRIKPYMSVLEYGSVALILGGMVWWFVSRKGRQRRRREQTAAEA